MSESLETSIEAYLEGRMNAAQREAFEVRLRNEQDVRDALALHQEATVAVRAIAREDLKSRIQGIDQNSSKGNHMGWWAAAAAVCILFGAAWWWNTKASFTGPELYAEHFSPYPDRLSTLGNGDAVLKKAMGHYQNQEFDSAAIYFQKLEQYSDSPDAIALYQSISLLAAGHPQQAIAELDRLKNSQTSFAEVAHWYHVLALLSNNQMEEARQSLSTYREKWSYQRKHADELWESLP